MTDMPEDVERILERLVCGDLTVDDPEVQELAMQHPGILVELKRLQSIGGAISDLGADAPEIVARASGNVTDEDRRVVRRIIERRRPWWWSPLLVAALVVIALAWWAWPRNDERPTGMLNAEGLARLEVQDEVVQVVFEAELPPGGRYHLRLDTGDDTLGAQLETETEKPKWQLPPDWIEAGRRARSPRLYVWVSEPGGIPVTSGTLDLSRLLR